jgi:N-acyl-D-aspartate/D-glutamate deacylase
MAHDIFIRKGTNVDGTGREPFQGDVAVDNCLITSVGGVAAAGREEIDATGLIVFPGFIDIHTHLDAQVGWDPLLTPLSWHGVTTALMGNCGVTFAPCRPDDRATLASTMECVEDIPASTILSGLPWNWESYGGYLDAVERLQPAINLAGMVGHSAVHVYVMGERAHDGATTEDEKQRIAALVARSRDEGAVGFSMNRLPAHAGADGQSIPGTFAEHDEVMQIGRVPA